MNKKEYKSIEKLLKEPSFVNWVNKSNIKDIDFWEHWINNNPECEALVIDAKDIIQGIQFRPTLISEEKINTELDKLTTRIATSSHKKHQSIFPKVAILKRIAATVIFLIATGAFYLWMSQAQHIFHQTAFGEKLELKLADGTKVTLNANSSLKYSKENPREVWMEGEAFFEVEKKPQTGAKFWVRTKDLSIEVLGTAFNVHSRGEKTQVILKEGKVNLQLDNGNKKEMKPGDLVSFSAKLNQVIEDKNTTNLDKRFSWKDESLFFEDISLEEAMNQIADVYGVQISYTDKVISKKRIHIGVPTTNLEICIRAMEISCQIKIEQSKNRLIISNLN